MAKYDWSKYRQEVSGGGNLWTTVKQKEEKKKYNKMLGGLYNEASTNMAIGNAVYNAEQRAQKKINKQNEINARVSSGKPFQRAMSKNLSDPKNYLTGMFKDSVYNPAAAFGETAFNKDYNSNLKKSYKANIEEQYSKVSNYKPSPKIIKQDTVPGKMTSFDKFKNQPLGIFGKITNLKKPKTVYQYKGGQLQDPVTGEMRDTIWEDILQISVVAESKDRYFYRVKGDGAGAIQSVPKNQVKEKLPDLEEQKLKYMEQQVNNKPQVASMYDKAMYNVQQGMQKFAFGGGEKKDQLKTGSEALDVATNIGGELLGFMTPTGAGTGIRGTLEEGLGQLGEKTLGGIAKKTPSVVSRQLTSGIGKAIGKGAVEMGAYSAMENKGEVSTTDKVKSILEDMVVGGAFMGTTYGLGKGVGKIMKRWKTIPNTPDTENLLTAARTEYENAANDLVFRDTTEIEHKTLMQEAADKFYKDVDEIAIKYGKEESITSKVANIKASRLETQKADLQVKLDDLNSQLEKVTASTEKTALAKEISSIEKQMKDLDLQMFGKSKSSTTPITTPPEINPNINKTGEHIISKADIANTKESMFNKIYRNIVDRNRPLEVLGKKTGTNKNLAVENPYKMASLASTYEGIAKSNIEQGIADKTGKKIGEGLADIMTRVPKGKANDFNDYLILRQAEYLAKNKPDVAQVYPKEWGLTAKDMNYKLKQVEAANPEFKNLANRTTFYNKRLAKTQLVDSGLLSSEEFRAMEKANPYFVPNKRAFTDVELARNQGGGRSGFVGQNEQIKSRVGSERQVISPFESMIENTFNFAKAAKRNEVGTTLYKQVEKNPDKFKGILEIVQKVDDPKYEVGRAVDEGDMSAFIDNINQGFEVKGVKDLSKPNIIRVRINGENRYMKVNDEILLDNLTNFSTDQISTFVNMVRAGTNQMKNLTTGINLMFGIARNVWRDLFTSFAQSKTLGNFPVVDYAEHIGGLVHSMLSMMGSNKTINKIGTKAGLDLGKGYKEFRAMGSGFFSSAVGTEKNLLKETVTKYTEKGLKTKAKQIAKSPISLLEWINNTLETMPRYPEYRRTVKKLTKAGVDEYAAKLEGVYNSQDITVNFKRSGQVTKDADAFVPYLNAAVQGLDKTLRVLDPRDPKQLARVLSKSVTGITIPALALYAMNRNNPKYQKTSDYIKDNFFLVPYGEKGEFIKIPKPRELGVLFGSLAERLAGDFADKNPEAWKGFTDTILQNFSPPNIVLDNMSAPIIRNVMSEEGRTWRGTPVVPQNLLKQSPRKQYDENTSAVAKWIGDKLNFAPKKVDEIMSSYLGGVAQLGKPLTSKRTQNEKGIIKAAIEVFKKQVTVDSEYQTDIADSFYKNVENVNMKKADLNAAGKLKGKGETYIDSATYVFNGVVKQVAELRAKQKKAKTNDEKDKIQNKMNNLMQKANDDYKKNYLKKKNMETIKRKREFTRRK